MSVDVSKYTQRLKDAVDKLNLPEKLEKLGFKKSKTVDDTGDLSLEAHKRKARNILDSASSLTRVLAGAPGDLGEYYFPPELIGGTCPRIPGEEEEIVWNAAAEACDTERVHVVWQSLENKIWYIAVRSNELASHPNTWCPFASLLPGMRDATVPPVCYTYFGDEMATMMTITADGLQIYRGTTLIVRAKAERTARELGNVLVVDLVPDKILQLVPIPWYSVSLFEDRARRVLAAISVFTSLVLVGLSFLVWLFASMSLIASKHNLTVTLDHTRDKTVELMKTTEKLRASPMREQLASFSELNDGLLAVNGYLEIYEIRDAKTRWRAIIPANITADRISALGGKMIETTPQGVAIGNQAQLDYQAANPGKK